MKKIVLLAPMLLAAFTISVIAQENAPQNVPQAEIANGSVHAKLYLPDASQGYYRGARFDWSGVIASLEYKGHNFFGVWFPRYDPKLNDAITGPVEEFRSTDGGLGYGQAKPGETFVKIGVGVLRKPDDKEYTFAREYDIVDGGKWTVKKGKDHVEFTQALTDASGYSYLYTKTVRLAKDKPELIIEHRLKNTGKLAIDTSVYNHDFYMLDGQTTGPDFSVKFGFKPHSDGDFKDLAKLQGNQLVYLAELQKKQTVSGYMEGFSADPKDNNTTVENKKAGIGVREVGNRPIAKLFLWSIPTTVCPEIYVHMNIEPGRVFSWQIAYDFYTIEPAK